MTTRRTPVNPEAIFRLLDLGDYLMPYTIRAVCLLGVADQLAEGALPVTRLAVATGAHEPSLRKALRYLCGREIFEEVAPDTFGLTPMADLLRVDHPYSARNIFLSPVACDRAMEGLDHALRTGEAGFDAVYGHSMWEHFQRYPEDGAGFDRAMSGVTGMELLAIRSVVDWSGYRTVVDVGGGNGRFLAELVRRFKGMRGILFDLPSVVAHAPDVLAETGVADRVDVVPGSFLEGPIPTGGDAYVLKRILYSWDDETVVGILSRLRSAMKPDSRLFIMEAARQDVQATHLANRMDLLMLTLSGGGARSVDEQEALLAEAGLDLVRSVATPMFPVLEARR